MVIGTRAGRSAYVRARRASPCKRDPARGTGRGPLRLRIPSRDCREPAGAGGPETDHPRERSVFGLGPAAPGGIPALDLFSSPPCGEGGAQRRVGRSALVERTGTKGVGLRPAGVIGATANLRAKFRRHLLDSERMFDTIRTCVLVVGRGGTGPRKRPSRRSIRSWIGSPPRTCIRVPRRRWGAATLVFIQS